MSRHSIRTVGRQRGTRLGLHRPPVLAPAPHPSVALLAPRANVPGYVSARAQAQREASSASTYAKISGATIVASDSITNRGVSIASFSQVIFSLGTAPE